MGAPELFADPTLQEADQTTRHRQSHPITTFSCLILLSPPYSSTRIVLILAHLLEIMKQLEGAEV